MSNRHYRWMYCADSIVSVAMKLETMGYGIHGHDIRIKLCLCSTTPAAIDVEELKRVISEITGSLTHKPLWEVVGKNEALIEDLLILIRDLTLQRINSRSGKMDVCLIRGITGSGVEISLTSSTCTNAI